jgi:hypothetical protein
VMARDADDPRYVRQFAMLHGEAEGYPRLKARYTETVVEPRRDVIRAVLRRGIAAGQLRADVDIDIALLALTGSVMARGKHDVVPADGFAGRVVDTLLAGIQS